MIGDARDCRCVVDRVDDDIKGRRDLPAVGICDRQRDRCCAREIGSGSHSDGAVCSGAGDRDVAIGDERLIGRGRGDREIVGSRFDVADREVEGAGVGVFVDRLIGDACHRRRVVD